MNTAPRRTVWWPPVDALLVFLLPLTLYWVTLPRQVMPEDDGLFILASYFNGVAHPPGYPLFTLTGHLFSLLPLGSVATRVHAASACFGAIAVLAVWWVLRLLGCRRAPAVAAALAFAGSDALWSQSTIAEVYSLNAALFFVCFALTLRALKPTSTNLEPPPKLDLRAVAFVYGLGLSNHWPLLGLATLGMVLLYLPHLTRVLLALPRALPYLLLGLMPYAWMFWRSNQEPAISFNGPLLDLSDLLFTLLRQGYAEVDHSEAATAGDKLAYAGFFLSEAWRQCTALGGALAILGFGLQWRRLGMVTASALTIAFIASGLLLAALLGFEYAAYWRDTFRPYPILAYGVLAIWLGFGLERLLALPVFSNPAGTATRPVTVLLLAAVALAPMLQNLPANDRRDDRFAADYARTLLDQLPPNSALFVHGDMMFGPIAYTSLVEGRRPDVEVFNPYGMVLQNRLIRPILFDGPERRARIADFVRQSERPVCYVGGGMVNFDVEENWLFRCIRSPAGGAGNSFRLSSEQLPFMQAVVDSRQPMRGWSRYLRDGLVQSLSNLLWNLKHLEATAPLAPRFETVLAESQRSFYGSFGAASALAEAPVEKTSLKAGQALRDQLLKQSGSADTRLAEAWVQHFDGLIKLREGDPAGARQSFENSLRIWPHRDNPSSAELQRLAATPTARTPSP